MRKRLVLTAIAAILTIGPGGGDRLFAQEAKPADVRVCLAKGRAPTDKCITATGVQLRAAPAPGNAPAGRMDYGLTVQALGSEMRKVLPIAGAGGEGVTEVEICIVNGANICPPEPFELVWTCITIGLLAGEECPEPPENATGVVVTTRLATRGN